MDGVEDTACDYQTADEDVSESDNNSECSSQQSEGDINWYYMPDSILLSIFQYLSPKELTIAGEVCRSWHRVSRDEFLWKYLFYRTYKIDPDVGIVPGMSFINSILMSSYFYIRLKIIYSVACYICEVKNININSTM